MHIEDIKLEEENKRELIKETKKNEFKSFMEELNEYINIEEAIYVVTDRRDEMLKVISISTGEEYEIYIAKSFEELEKLNSNKVYGISEDDFYKIDLGSNIILKNDKCKIYNRKIKIENIKAKNKLEELYFNLKEEEGMLYSVDKIKDEKIYLKGQDGGYFSIYKRAYPDIKNGDILKKENGRYNIVK